MIISQDLEKYPIYNKTLSKLGINKNILKVCKVAKKKKKLQLILELIVTNW